MTGVVAGPIRTSQLPDAFNSPREELQLIANLVNNPPLFSPVARAWAANQDRSYVPLLRSYQESPILSPLVSKVQRNDALPREMQAKQSVQAVFQIVVAAAKKYPDASKFLKDTQDLVSAKRLEQIVKWMKQKEDEALVSFHNAIWGIGYFNLRNAENIRASLENPVNSGSLGAYHTLRITPVLLSIPKEISHLRNLTKIILRQNFIPEGIQHATHLETLDVSTCNLTEVPSFIRQMTSLKRLDFGFNKLKSLPESIANLPNLERIDISCNNMRIPLWLKRFSHRCNVVDLSWQNPPAAETIWEAIVIGLSETWDDWVAFFEWFFSHIAYPFVSAWKFLTSSP